MFEREFHQHVADVMHEIAKEIEKDLPEEVVKDLHEMAACQARITARIRWNKALSSEDVKLYNDMCYKHFSKVQDGGEFTKEEPETAKPIIVKKAPQPEAGTWGDWKVEDIVRNYIIDHLDKSDPEKPDFDVYIVWKCKTLQNWKYLLASTLPDGMYYEMTFNGDKNEWYLDAYRKVENKVIPGAKK